MKYLTLALWAEGPSDHPFLKPVLRRLLTDHLLKSSRPVDVAEEFVALPDPEPDKGRDKRITAAIARRTGEISLLFIHTDGGGDVARAHHDRVQPAMTLIATLAEPPHCIAVIPKRETEAWMLADPNAIAYALGVEASRLAGIPPCHEVEQHHDPKQCLEEVRASFRQRRRKPPLLDLRQVGEAASLQALRRLSAFQILDAELQRCLDKLGLL